MERHLVTVLILCVGCFLIALAATDWAFVIAAESGLLLKQQAGGPLVFDVVFFLLGVAAIYGAVLMARRK